MDPIHFIGPLIGLNENTKLSVPIYLSSKSKYGRILSYYRSCINNFVYSITQNAAKIGVGHLMFSLLNG